VKYALNVGINTYPRSPLQGCVNDAVDWRMALQARGFDCHSLHDDEASRENVMRWLASMLDASDSDDVAVFTFSGHGTQGPDVDGDEVDGWDEMICAWPARSRGDMIADDDLYGPFADADRRGVRVIFVSDSCHSGTLQRFAGPLAALAEGGEVLVEPASYRRARWLSPAEWMNAEDLRRAAPSFAPPLGLSRRSALVLSGCRADQVAYDAYLDGRYRGAFTAAALDALASLESSRPIAGRGWNYRQWHRAIRARLPSVDFDQVPQLDGSAAQRRWLLLDEQGRR